jgi:hypothetical protein
LGLRFRCCMKRFERFHLVLSDVARSDLRCFHPVLFDVAWSDLRCFTIVLMMLQHFVSRVSSATLTCCDICILIFHCGLANVADAESRCFRHVLLGVANIIFQCCRRCVSILQTCGVGCCVEEKGEEAPNVGCYTPRVATWP